MNNLSKLDIAGQHNQGNAAAFKDISMSAHKRLVLKIVPYNKRILKKG
jgi:hypothetical protein